MDQMRPVKQRGPRLMLDGMQELRVPGPCEPIAQTDRKSGIKKMSQIKAACALDDCATTTPVTMTASKWAPPKIRLDLNLFMGAGAVGSSEGHLSSNGRVSQVAAGASGLKANATRDGGKQCTAAHFQLLHPPLYGSVTRCSSGNFNKFLFGSNSRFLSLGVGLK
jgi:hypothetical protein